MFCVQCTFFCVLWRWGKFRGLRVRITGGAQWQAGWNNIYFGVLWLKISIFVDLFFIFLCITFYMFFVFMFRKMAIFAFCLPKLLLRWCARCDSCYWTDLMRWDRWFLSVFEAVHTVSQCDTIGLMRASSKLGAYRGRRRKAVSQIIFLWAFDQSRLSQCFLRSGNVLFCFLLYFVNFHVFFFTRRWIIEDDVRGTRDTRVLVEAVTYKNWVQGTDAVNMQPRIMFKTNQPTKTAGEWGPKWHRLQGHT